VRPSGGRDLDHDVYAILQGVNHRSELGASDLATWTIKRMAYMLWIVQVRAVVRRARLKRQA